MAMKYKGANEVLKNLNKFILKSNIATHAGLATAYSFIKKESIRRTPVDTGHLKGSFYSRRLAYKGGPALEVGNTAEYALYVHENLENKHITGESKFLEKTIVENTDTILNILASRLKV